VDDVRWTGAGEATILSDQFFLEWLMFREDDIECAARGREFVTAHSVILVPPGEEIRTRWRSGRLRTVSCCFRPELLSDNPELLSFLCSLGEDRWFNVDSLFLQAGLSRIADECVNPGFDSNFMVRALLQSVCVEVRRTVVDRTGSEETDGRLSPGQLNRLRQALHDSSTLPSVEELASHCGIGARTLPLLVKQTTGTTLRNYIARERLIRAKALLDDHRLMVKQVAFSCGFGSPAAFTAAFRKTTGMTPVEYRMRN
jgi:AraC family transcriptional regulator